MVTKLDRLAQSLPDARDILDELTKRNVKLGLSGSTHDPTPAGRLLFNVFAMVAEFQSDLIRLRTRIRPNLELVGALPRAGPTRLSLVSVDDRSVTHAPRRAGPAGPQRSRGAGRATEWM